MPRQPRRARRIDNGQREAVEALRDIPGVSVEVDMDDFLIGYKGINYWIEWKSPDAISKRTGEVKDSEITKSERDRLDNWKGHYLMTASLEEILKIMRICGRVK